MEITKAIVNGEELYRVYSDGGIIATFQNEALAIRFVRNQMPFEITKSYHFYASHRNETLTDKCYSLHGHNYRVKVVLQFHDPSNKESVTMLFSDIDNFIEPIIKELDHASLWNSNDPFFKDIKKYLDQYGMKYVEWDYPTSVENMSKYLYSRIARKGLPIRRILIQETESSIVTYEQ